MRSFKNFMESDEPKVIRLSLKRPASDPNVMSSKEFIRLFNNEVEAQDTIGGNKAYMDGDSIVQYSLRPDFMSDSVYVSDLVVMPRGFAAIRFLQKITELADKHKVTLTCISEPLKVKDKVNKKRLTSLYKRFGFKQQAGKKDYLIRRPN